MYFSGVKSQSINQKDIGAFYGVNRTNRINDYQLSDCKNMDCESFPYFSTRRKREVFYDENPMSAICHDTDIENDYKVTGVTRDGNFVYRGNYINCAGELIGTEGMCEYLGDYVCFPNMQAVSSLGFMTDTSKTGSVEFRNTNVLSNTTYLSVVAQKNKVWLDVTCDRTCRVFTNVISPYVSGGVIAAGKVLKIGYQYIKNMLSMNATVNDVEPCNDCFFVVQNVESAENSDGYTDYSIEMTAHTYSGDDFDYEQYLRSNEELNAAAEGNLYSVSGRVDFSLGYYGNGSTHWYVYPYLEFHQAPFSLGASYGGRLFACDVFGVDIFYSSGSGIVGEKYDFTPGTSAGGAGFVSCSDHGRWTALIPYGGALYAFKRNAMYKIYSADGLSFYMEKICDVGAVNDKAVCVVSDVMYFLSETGLYKFTGSYPQQLPANLNRVYTHGVLGGVDNKLYASLAYSGGRELVVYDARVNAYGVHDDFNALNFVSYGGELYALSDDGVVYRFADNKEAVEFELLTRKFFLSFEKKAINALRLYFDFSGRENEKIEVFVSYDGGEWEPCFKPITSGKLKYVPIKFKKCDELCVKIKGNGIFTLKGMTMSFYSGGDIKQNK